MVRIVIVLILLGVAVVLWKRIQARRRTRDYQNAVDDAISDADLLIANNRMDGARKVLERALTQYPGNARLQAKIRQIDTIE